MTPTYNSYRNREGWSLVSPEVSSQSVSKIDTRMERTPCPRARNWKLCAGQVRKKWGFSLANVLMISYITVHLK